MKRNASSAVESGEGLDANDGTEPSWVRFVEGTIPAGAQGTVRIAALLQIVAAHNFAGMKLNEIAELAGLEQSTAHRIVTALHSVGFVSRDPKTKRFYLGSLLFELFTTAFPHFNIRELCQPVIERLARQLGDTVYLTVRSGFDSICADRCEGSNPIRTCTVEIGQRRPLGLGAGSLTLLASLTNAEMDTVLRHNIDRYGHYGIDLDMMRERLAWAQEKGYIHQAALTSTEVHGIGVPICGKTGHVFGALSVSALATQMTEERIASHISGLQKAAAEIQMEIAKLGYV